ncbi:MAG: DUF1570 domain-containing protein [Thermoguttaceae bacterium]|nr:DUF1570 domain-containing protein [Thermoguttaceae bacterium]
MKRTIQSRRVFGRFHARLIGVARLAVFAAVCGAAASGAAIDYSLNFPLPRFDMPYLPNFNTPRGDPPPELKAEYEARLREGEGTGRDDWAPVEREGDELGDGYFQAPVADAGGSEPVDLSPEFSNRLPYSVALGRVVCEANFPIESVPGLEAEITRLQRDLVEYLRIPEANEKIELCLFRDKGSYVDFIGSIFPGAPADRPALYVKASGPGVLMIPRDENMIVNIRHEMTHAYLNAALRNVPIWLDEGLAKYFETPPGERGFSNPYLKDVEKKATVFSFFKTAPSLERLEKLNRVDEMKSREYRESWSWVHFMMHYSKESHRALATYLWSLRPESQAGITAKDAEKLRKKAPMKTILESRVPDCKKKFIEHFQNWDDRKARYEASRAQAKSAADL